MPAATEPNRRFTIALTAAVATTTVAIGVTAATLLGWFRPVSPREPATTSAAERSVVYVPIAPASAPDTSLPTTASLGPEQLAMEQPPERDDDREREHEREGDDD